MRLTLSSGTAVQLFRIIQLSASVPEKVSDGPAIWAFETHMGDPDWVPGPGFCLIYSQPYRVWPANLSTSVLLNVCFCVFIPLFLCLTNEKKLFFKKAYTLWSLFGKEQIYKCVVVSQVCVGGSHFLSFSIIGHDRFEGADMQWTALSLVKNPALPLGGGADHTESGKHRPLLGDKCCQPPSGQGRLPIMSTNLRKKTQ